MLSMGSFYRISSCKFFRSFFLVFLLLFSSFSIIGVRSDSFFSSRSSFSTGLANFNSFSSLSSGSSNNSTVLTGLSLNLDFSSFFANSSGRSIALDYSGNTIVTGTVYSDSLPIKNAFQSSFTGFHDVFIAKFDSTGVLIFCTYFGGNDIQKSTDLAVDTDGNIYITGTTSSLDFPTKNAFDSPHSSNFSQAGFIAKFNPNGALVFSTIFQGNDSDTITSIAVDTDGTCFITGTTYSTNFPSKYHFQNSFAGGSTDSFVAKFNSTGSLVFSSFFGGDREEFSNDITVDNSSNFYITGITSSSNFPSKNSNQSIIYSKTARYYDVYIAKFNSSGSLIFSILFGGSNTEYSDHIPIALDSNGIIYLAGSTYSTDLPLKDALNITPDSDLNIPKAYFAKFNTTGNLIFSTYLGFDILAGITIDKFNNCFITGEITPNNDSTVNSVNNTAFGNNNIFLLEINNSNELAYSSYVGSAFVSDITVDSNNDLFITGSTNSCSFLNNEFTDGLNNYFFMAKFTLQLATVTQSSSNNLLSGCVTNLSGSNNNTGFNIWIFQIPGFNQDFNILDLIFIPFLFVSVFFIGDSYRRFRKIPASKRKSFFRSYLKNRFLKRVKKFNSRPLLSDETFQLLEEIEEENSP